MKENIIRGILVKPGQKPEEVRFNSGYKELQRLVEGPFEMPAYFDDVDIVVNEEGKLNGSHPNKGIFYHGGLIDIIFGNIVVVASDEEGNTVSLNDEAFNKYMKVFEKNEILLG